jgi:arylsulfatase A-like enzyme
MARNNRILPLILATGTIGLLADTGAATDIHHGAGTNAGTRTRAGRLRLPMPGEFNVLLIVLDDVGTDKFAMYGNDVGAPAHCLSPQINGIPTPNLDQLRADGVMFSRCYVNPTCSPTRAALLTGRYGLRTGMGHAINPSDAPGYELPTGETCLPELLRDVNTFAYRRAAFGKWHLTDYDANDCHPAESGFERFEGVMGNPESHYDWRKVSSVGGGVSGCTSTLSADVPGVEDLAPSADFWDAAVTRDDAATWIGGLAGTDRFFAYVCFSPPHAPFEVPPYSTLSARTQARLAFNGYEAGDRARSGEADDEKLIYHANVEAVDHEIGELLAAIAPAVLARTMVVVIGDNGTVATMITDAALTGHGKRTLYELGTRVPLIVSGPLVGTHAGETCRALVGAVDVWRTVAEMTGLRSAEIDAAMGGSPVDSESFLLGILDPSSALVRTTAYSEAFSNETPPILNFGYRRGITDGSYRYMRNWSDGGGLTENLFHTAMDPCEFTDLLAPPHVLTPAEAAALAALQAAMDAI